MAVLTFMKTLLCLVTCPVLFAAPAAAEPAPQASDLETALLRAVEQAPESAKFVAEIEAWMAPTFEALPKLGQTGRLGKRASRHLLQTYFNANFGWHIKGLESHEQQRETTVQGLDKVGIVQEKAPKLAQLLSKVDPAKTGLSLSELAAYAAVLQRLVLRESKIVLKAAWRYQNHSASDDLTWEDLTQVLHSCLLLLNDWNPGLLNENQMKLGITAPMHTYFGATLEKARNNTESWQRGEAFVAQVAGRLRGVPSDAESTPERFSFKAAQPVFLDLFVEYGKHQNADCVEMKDQLRGMDGRESGRVPLKSFYAAPEGSKFWFAESPKYLHKLGLLDNTNRQSPSVLVTNYVDSATNCLAPAPFFSICCISECTGLMAKIEAAVKAPAASATTLLSAVANATRAGSHEPRALVPELVEQLQGIEQMSGGEIQLHGRLFAQWLHYVEPYKCAYPLEARTQVNWVKMNKVVDLKEKESYIETLGDATPMAASDTIITQWSNEELLPLKDDVKDSDKLMRRETVTPSDAQHSSSAARQVVIQLVLLVAVLSLLWASVQIALRGYRQKQIESELLMYESKATANKTSAASKSTKGKGGPAVKKSLSAGSTPTAEKQQAKQASTQKPRRNQKAAPKTDAQESETAKPQVKEPSRTGAPTEAPETAAAAEAVAEEATATVLEEEETPAVETSEKEMACEQTEETPAVETSEKEMACEQAEETPSAETSEKEMACEQTEEAPPVELSKKKMACAQVEESVGEGAAAQATAVAAAAKAAAAAEAAAKAAAARAAAAEAAAAAAAAALAAEAAEAAAAEAQAEAAGETEQATIEEDQPPPPKPVPPGFEALQRVGLLGPSAPKKGNPPARMLPAGFRPPPGLEMFGPMAGPHGNF